MTKSHSGERFYFFMGLILITIVIAGFTPFILKRIDQEGSLSPIFIIHGIVYLGWFLLFIFQTRLIASQNIALHIKMGKSSLYLAGAIIITGVMVTLDAWNRGSNGGTPFTKEHFILLPVMDLILFTLGYTLAYRARKIAASHKHYMLITSIMMIEPATARLAMTLGVMPISLLLHFSFIVALIIYDKKTGGAIHKASLVGLSLLIVRYLCFFLIGPTEAWASFARVIFG